MSDTDQPKVRVIEPRTTVIVIPPTAGKDSETIKETKKRVCAYCRVSTDLDEQQTSYALQVVHYTKFIKKNTLWEFSGVYADEGISGTSIKNRTEFLRMIEDCKAGKIDMIITKSISRFARNTLDCLNYVRMLKSLTSPVGIYFEKEAIDTLDAKSELLLTILSSLAQEESRSISENVRWSIQKRYQQGLAHCPTNNFLGYDSDENGNMVINEEQAETVRRIYRECLAGHRIGIIAKMLEEEGLKTGKGLTKWSGNTVNKILRNEKYCGDIMMQKRVTLDFLTHQRTLNKGHQTQYFMADHHPAIVSKEDWNSVQFELDRRIKTRAVNGDKSLKSRGKLAFSDILFCSICGEPFIRRIHKSTKNNRDYIYPVWKCRVSDGRKVGMVCKARSYREEAIERSFMDMLHEIRNDQENFVKEAEMAIAQDDLDDIEKERLEYIETQIESLQESLSQVAASAYKGPAVDLYDDLSIDLEQEIEILQTEKGALNKKKQEAMAKKRTLNWLVAELNIFKDFDPAQERTDFLEYIFRRIIERGDVFDDGCIVYEFAFGVTMRTTDNDYVARKSYD